MQRRTVLAGLGSLSGLLALSGCLSDDHGEIDEFERGEIEITIDGESIESMDKIQSEYADNDSIDFHLHEFDDYWYMEGEERVTVAEGLTLLPHFEYERVDDSNVVTFDGTVYDERDSETTITVEVDGEEVDPTAHELADREALVLEIESGESD
ncbi:uncharacterized protein Nmag_1931 [Natrialba magadii ATCC 43099]|uniref:Uncharacterized protein n=1 Tax=Natrialba magadii (strain ATCC 43099 / DSM 3394 / CCM 3739 / CIP 104546 / IAM 13178 / JCM 8861 / NBRC 102185 / NCIMB 2190 / MS3) TaxID=547559 RepID=D3SV94_NATMM|nr:hypothetical protein [Natrialba magadii]ADD05502.1 uncharacterized protein Nmag_1931 [Natrialba magadii ATCC 43099]ELY29535.1 hypothetical protein C500_10738 [Natrialba magadii ATCC 43099]